MRSIQKIGAVGAFVQAIYFLILVLFVTAILPSRGFPATADAYHDPAVALPFAAQSPLRALDELRDIIWGIGLILTAMALHERWQSRTGYATRFMLALGIIGTALLFASGIGGFTSISELAKLYSQGATDAAPAYLAVTLMAGGLRGAAVIVFGGWVLLTSWLALKRAELPRLLNYIGLAVGIVGLGALVIPGATSILVIAGFVWLVWLAMALWRLEDQVAVQRNGT
jgi:hypothetical protein